MKPVIYFNRTLTEPEERCVASKYFHVVNRRTAIPSGSLVIPRYSALPNNIELEEDVSALGSMLINSHEQHAYVANLQNWYYDLQEYTPKTWFTLADVLADDTEDGPYILKGQTNSKKELFSTHMYAENKAVVLDVYQRLQNDGYLCAQKIYIRKYIELERVCWPASDDAAPVSNEQRVFVLDGEILCNGFYWSGYEDEWHNHKKNLPYYMVPRNFVQKVIDIVKKNIRFFVVDFAKTADGDWIVVELNDGQQSGLSCVLPEDLYSALYNHLK